jgi:NADH:ubiquinone oxidoreductase subunit F (NADH-binding)
MTATAGDAPPALHAPGPAGITRLLHGLTADRPTTLAVHRLTLPRPPAPSRRPDLGLLDDVDASGLRGRGGASFPTGTKLRSVLGGRRAPTVVVNGSEGEPASAKDRLLLTAAPHLVLDGALIAAAATGAPDLAVCIDRANRPAIAAVEAALGERRRAGEPSPDVRVVTVPARFVAGEESALVHLLNGGEAKPTAKPPRVFERGVDGRPTVILNVETVAHLAQIARWGPGWFRTCGTVEEPGTLLTTVSGAVGRPGVHEVPCGTPIVRAVQAAGGATRQPAAVLVGGYYGAWLDAADAEGAALSNASLRPFGAAIGCAALVVFPHECCGLAETARLLAWMNAQSAGQCGPCVHGLAALAGTMHTLATGRSSHEVPAQLQRWATMIDGRGGCTLPDGAARLVRSALRVFAADVEHHLHHGPCWRTANRPLLPTPPPAATWK